MTTPRTEIIVSAGGEQIGVHVLGPGEYVIGREEGCEIVTAVAGVSRRHAMLTVNFGDMLIEDLGSENGTFVTGKAVTEAVRLWPGQSVKVGEATITTRRLRSEDDGESLLPWTAELRKQLPEELRREGRYAINSLVAQGGMGAILDARDQTIRRTVAMKVMLDPRFQDDMVRFIEEAQVTGQLEHPNIVPIYELGVDAHEQVFYTMKFVRGITLKKVLELLGAGTVGTIAKYPLAALLTVFQKVCDAVAFAHSRGVIHRDLKPENVMIGDFGEVLVMDWGLAKTLRPKTDHPLVRIPRDGGAMPSIKSVRGDSGELGATVAGTIMGTPNFMAPEQAEGHIVDIDARSDIFALGGILYSILTLQMPFTGDTVEEILEKVVSGKITPPAKLNGLTQRRKGAKEDEAAGASALPVAPLRLCVKHLPGGRVPDSLSAVAMKALATKPADRYQTVPDLQKDIEAYQGGFATSAERAGAGKQLLLLLKRNKAASVGAAAVLLVGAIFGTKALLEGQRAERMLVELRGTAPTFAAQSRALLAEGKLEEALAKIGYAVTLASDDAGYHLTRANLLQSTQYLSEAVSEYRRVLALRAGDASAKENLALSERLLAAKGNALELPMLAQGQLLDALIAQRRDLESAPLSRVLRRDGQTNEATLRARLAAYASQPKWNEKRIHTLPGGGLGVELSDLQIGDLGVLRGLPIITLMLNRTIVSDLTPLAGLPLNRLELMETKVSDLAPLRGMQLTHLVLTNCAAIADLSPLAGMPLRGLHAFNTKVADLSPLRGAPISYLGLDNTRVADLSPLVGMPLTYLGLANLPLTVIEPIRGMPLRELRLHGVDRLQDLSPLRECVALEKVTLPWEIRDIAILARLPKLAQVELHKGNDSESWTPAAEFLTTYGPEVPEIKTARAAFAAAGLGELAIPRIKVGADHRLIMDLKEFPIPDLAPLKGLPINHLNLESTNVSSLEPLRGMPLSELLLARSNIRDPEPLRGMPLTKLFLFMTKVRDVSPLADCLELEELELPVGAINVGRLRGLSKLRYLSFRWNTDAHRPAQTPEEFWKEFDLKKADAGK